MNSLFTLSLLLTTIQTPLVGQLFLQEPAVEYYFTRESGTVTAVKDFEIGNLVKKGDALLNIEPAANDASDKVIMANTNGYIEYINERVNTKSPVVAGDLLLKLSSNYVLGNYYLDKSYELSGLPRYLWLCLKTKPIKFKVDSVLKDRLLISIELGQILYSELVKLPELNQMQLFTEKNICVSK
ncbi:hypothetical protein [Pseudoalteromonas luteoviolacea]|uniref:Uncharacterized protein n=1 Tax=Pseudoalteromonas luteoviolacea S4054 TaxID=1129367 RepID=A0A0F6A810_9GAMM|nr:hypothetical protein [Pseudoalteromonas luteoviolacea]AOT10084.1 hypothetical protein S4054249_20715 [Pseudoalteromonas luteoviolacea]AOT14995.1 hypothetical protein S40542_20680 [Pseudoalteromonas luteoviolacea]AOT19911.1 hypothetical protein S4054_20685 [Pseudoalteromonas luteoviolacea]KKE82347.1 hypothetical protein N479_01855 [Pseudoalteromonas luteoviolacea S4054]KZN77973.1 hypothetical protein N481_03865 [Pseudoalteromonas luteoviolacea S4047-1]